MLFLVATPIGNLEDISLRAINTLKACDYILCEDTRHSLKLLQHYEIQKPLVSFHQFNEEGRKMRVLDDLQSGKQIALISDAGTPLISDPGFSLVKACQKVQVRVTSIPGASSCLMGLILSGFSSIPFQFVGFLPKKRGELERTLQELLEYEGTTVCYETAERIEETLNLLQELDPERNVAIARELTKRFETVVVGTAQELIEKHKKEPMRGEIVLVLEGQKSQPESIFSDEFLLHCVEDVAKSHSIKEAIILVAKQLNLPKRIVYAAVHK